MPEISKEEARKRLEDSVKTVDWITHFLGDETKQQDFLEVYRGLNAQLREGDRLEIEIDPYMLSREKYADIATAAFSIILHLKDGKKEKVYQKSTGSEIGSGRLLYKN